MNSDLKESVVTSLAEEVCSEESTEGAADITNICLATPLVDEEV